MSVFAKNYAVGLEQLFAGLPLHALVNFALCLAHADTSTETCFAQAAEAECLRSVAKQNQRPHVHSRAHELAANAVARLSNEHTSHGKIGAMLAFCRTSLTEVCTSGQQELLAGQLAIVSPIEFSRGLEVYDVLLFVYTQYYRVRRLKKKDIPVQAEVCLKPLREVWARVEVTSGSHVPQVRLWAYECALLMQELFTTLKDKKTASTVKVHIEGATPKLVAAGLGYAEVLRDTLFANFS